MSGPEFSLISCTLGGAEGDLRRFFDSLANQDFRDFELVLVDQGPARQLDRLVDAYRDRFVIRHLRSERGLSRSRNVGVMNARGRFVGFPDDDCWYPADGLTRLSRRLSERPELDVILGKTIDPSGRESVGSFRRIGGSVSKWNVWRSGNSAAMLVRRRLVTEVGGFDESLGVGSHTPFQSGEDTDLILQVLAAGATATYDPDFKVYHHQVDSEMDARTLVRARCYSLGFGRVLRKHQYGVLYLLYRLSRSTIRSMLAAAVLDAGLARYKMIWAKGTLEGYLAENTDAPVISPDIPDQSSRRGRIRASIMRSRSAGVRR